MPEYAEIYVNVLILSKWLLFYFPIVIPCLPEGVVTCFSVYSKLEVLHGFYEDYEAVFLFSYFFCSSWKYLICFFILD